MTEHTVIDAHALLEWLAGCDSRDEMHSAIRAWLQANPRPPTAEERASAISERVDAALSGWYQAYYDPRVVAPAIAELEEIASLMVRESGRPDGFDTRAWVAAWVHEPHPALNNECPVYLLSTPEGVEQVRALLSRQQSGAYS